MADSCIMIHMNKIFTIVGIIIIAVLAFVFVHKKPAEAPAETPAPVTEETPATEPAPSSPSGSEAHSYTNSEFKFAVNLPGLVVTKKASTDPVYKPTIFTFGVGDQSTVAEEKRIPNTMAVYVWANPAEFQILMSQKATIGTETVNGHEFSVYIITEGERTSYRYATNQGGKTYDVGVWNRADIKKFFLLD